MSYKRLIIKYLGNHMICLKLEGLKAKPNSKKPLCLYELPPSGLSNILETGAVLGNYDFNFFDFSGTETKWMIFFCGCS